MVPANSRFKKLEDGEFIGLDVAFQAHFPLRKRI